MLHKLSLTVPCAGNALVEVFGPGGGLLVRGAPSRLNAESIRNRHRALLADAGAAGGSQGSGSPARRAEGGPSAGARASTADVVRWAARAGDRALAEGELGLGEGMGLLDAAVAAVPPAAPPLSNAPLGGGAPGLRPAGPPEGGAAGRLRSYSAVASATAASAASTAGAAEFPAAAPVAGSAPAPADAAAAQVRVLALSAASPGSIGLPQVTAHNWCVVG